MQQSSLHTGAMGDAGFEIARHDFKLTEEGERIAKEKAALDQDAWRKLQEAVTRFKEAGDVDYMKMSVAAKTYFVLSEKGKPASVAELIESARALGWSPKHEEVLDSVKFLQDLGLASANPT